MSIDRCHDCDQWMDTDYPDDMDYGKRNGRDILLCDRCIDALSDEEIKEFYVERPEVAKEILEGR